MRSKNQSALVFVLKGLIPYTKENLLLSFSPNRFFNELEKVSGYEKNTLKIAYQRAGKSGYTKTSGNRIRLTNKGLVYVQPFVATKLKNEAQLMIIFDIPEEFAYKRRLLRELLKTWSFRQIQKSVWVSNMDHRGAIKIAANELEIKPFIEIFEVAKLDK